MIIAFMMALILIGAILLWYFFDISLPVAAVLIFMVEIVVNVIGYHCFGWWNS